MVSLLLVAFSSALLFISCLLIKIAIRNFFIFRKFAIESPGLPIVKNGNIIAGHSFSLMLNHRNTYLFGDLHDQLGPSYAWFLHDLPVVQTTDLDLIKTINLDEPYDHLDRFRIVNLPVKELKDSILFAPKKHWTKLRKAMAPAFR